MRFITKFTVAATLAISAAAAATSASALTFATFGPTADERIVWNRIDNGNLRNGVLFTSDDKAYQPNQAVPTAISTTFNFLLPTLAGMTGLQTDFTLYATETQTVNTISGTTIDQTNIDGTFSFVYTGPTFLTVNNVLVQTGANLLSGSFTNATISGTKFASTATFGATAPAQGVTFTSDFVNFASAQGQDINLDFINVLQPYGTGANAGRALPDFRAEVGGQFSLTSIPEPGTWALMIMGFGGAGAMLRSNRRRALAVV